MPDSSTPHDQLSFGTRRPTFRRRVLRRLQSYLGYSPIPELYLRRTARTGAAIMFYHSVSDDKDARYLDPRFRMSPACFRRQMQFLSGHRRVVSLSDLVSEIARGAPIDPGTVVITFDDGYRDNCTVAVPILQELGLPATFFLATRYVEDGKPQWVDELHWIFCSRRNASLQVSEGDLQHTFDLENSDDRHAAFSLLAEQLLCGTYERREVLLADTADQLGSDRALMPRLTANWCEIQQAVKDHPLIEIGSHTASHRDLTSCSSDEISKEICESVNALKSQLGSSPRFFSFPYNRVARSAMPVLTSAGFEAACAGEQGGWVPSVFELPRFEALTDFGLFRLMTSGAYPELSVRLFGRG